MSDFGVSGEPERGISQVQTTCKSVKYPWLFNLKTYFQGTSENIVLFVPVLYYWDIQIIK